ncbi:MAG: hypothetical protein ACOCP8_03820 [archaeon]
MDIDKIVEKSQENLSISNISVSGKLCEKLFIEHIAKEDSFFENPVGDASIRANFPDYSKENTITYLIYSTGRFILGGARTSEEVEETLNIIKEKIEKISKNPYRDNENCYSIDPIHKIENIIFSGELPCQIRMESIEENKDRDDIILVDDSSEVDVSLDNKIKHIKTFPGIIIHTPKDQSETVTFFESGKFNISGIKDGKIKNAKKRAKEVVEWSINKLNSIDNVFKWVPLQISGSKIRKVSKGEELELTGKIKNIGTEKTVQDVILTDEEGEIFDKTNVEIKPNKSENVKLVLDTDKLKQGDNKVFMKNDCDSVEITVKMSY